MPDTFMKDKFTSDPDVDTPDERFEECWNVYGKGWATLKNFGYDPDVNGLRKFANAFYEMGVEDAQAYGSMWKKKRA